MSGSILAPVRSAVVALFALAPIGCADRGASPPGSAAAPDPVEAERAKLGPDDRALVEAQEWCVISTDERLGSMGAPLKLTVNGQPVFVCCKGCVRKAEANPDATLAKVEELKARAKSRDRVRGE